MTEVLDYSAGYPKGSEIKKIASGVIRYLRKEGSSSVRFVTKNEIADLQANGLNVGFIYEHIKPNRAKEGATAGQHDGLWALDRIKELAIEPNSNYAVYFAVDYDAPVSDYPAIFQYFRGLQTAFNIKRIGGYAKYDLLRRLFDEGLITYGWQTYAWSPSHNKDPQTFEPRAHLFQNLATRVVDGIKCDINTVLKSYWGQLGGQPLPPTPPIPPKPPEVKDMQLNDVIGTDAGGSPVTVAQALLKSYNTQVLPVGQILEAINKLPDEIREIATQRYKDLADILYAFDNQSSWQNLGAWDSVVTKKWAQL